MAERGEFFLTQAGQLHHHLWIQPAGEHFQGNAARVFFTPLQPSFFSTFFTTFLFQPFGNRHHELLVPGRLLRQFANEWPGFFRGSRLQHIAD